MRAASLLDTNVLLYAISSAAEEALKKTRARELLAGDDYGLSVQILQEFYVNATRSAMTHEEASAALHQFAQCPLVPTDWPLVQRALQLKARYRINYWDAAILAAAQALGANTVYSEDLAHGQDYGGVRVVNPFA